MLPGSWNQAASVNPYLLPRQPPVHPPRSHRPFSPLPPVRPSSTRSVAPSPGPVMYQARQPDQTYAVPDGNLAPTAPMAWQIPANVAPNSYASLAGFGYAGQAVASNPVPAQSPLPLASTMLPVDAVMPATVAVESFNPNAEPPFADPNRQGGPKNYGVIKIKNVSILFADLSLEIGERSRQSSQHNVFSVQPYTDNTKIMPSHADTDLELTCVSSFIDSIRYHHGRSPPVCCKACL